MCADRTIFKPLNTPPTHWTKEQLDGLRQDTDEPADELIAQYFANKGKDQKPHDLLISLMSHRVELRTSEHVGETAGKVSAADVPIPQQLLDELEARCPLPIVDAAEIREGQDVFMEYGPEMLLALCCYSLPMAYSAANGAKVLHQTGYLENRVARRLVETTQMVIDVMKPGGLRVGGHGLRAAHEIRLLHATIRHLIKQGDKQWDTAAWGQPINQEDMAGTLLTFSYIVLDGLSKIGIELTRSEQESYLAAWRAIGQAMGLKEELLPANMELAQELTWFIFERQRNESEEGRNLMRALLDTMRSFTPILARPFCASMVQLYVGRTTADILGVPRNFLLDAITRKSQRLYGALDNLLHFSPAGLGGYRIFSHIVMKMLLLIGRGDNREAKFDLPTELHEYWKKSKR